MNLDDNYKQCFCGEELKKATRCAIVMQVPKSFNLGKRYKEKGYTYNGVVYCCETCYLKYITPIKEANGGRSFCYYPKHYPM